MFRIHYISIILHFQRRGTSDLCFVDTNIIVLAIYYALEFDDINQPVIKNVAKSLARNSI